MQKPENGLIEKMQITYSVANGLPATIHGEENPVSEREKERVSILLEEKECRPTFKNDVLLPKSAMQNTGTVVYKREVKPPDK